MVEGIDVGNSEMLYLISLPPSVDITPDLSCFTAFPLVSSKPLYLQNSKAAYRVVQSHNGEYQLQNDLNVGNTAGSSADRDADQHNANRQQEPVGSDAAPTFRKRMTDLNRQTGTSSRL
jgi:hypothetical protein